MFSAPKSPLRAVLLGCLGLCLVACESVPEKPKIIYTGDPVNDGISELAVAPQKDKVLWNYRIATAAMRAGRYDEARRQLDAAIPLSGGMLANTADAKKARRLFSSESNKTYIGEPYERVMAFYYRAILYWMEGQPDNARACYRTGQLIDSDAEENTYKSDYILLDYLEALANAKLSADPTDPLARAQKTAKGKLPNLDPQANVLLFVEYGRGPKKYAGGENGEQLKFMVSDSPAKSARLLIEGKTIPLPPYDDVNFQASTRGGRVMDHILGNKAVFKETTGAVGDVALVGAAIAAANIERGDGSHSQNAQAAAIALGAIGLISKIASAATATQADTRTWDNLPQRLSFAAVHLPAGDHNAQLEFLDKYDHPLPGRGGPVTISVKTEGDTTVFLSEHKR